MSVTVLATESVVTQALIVSDGVIAPASDAGSLHGALVDVLLAVAASEAGVPTVTGVVVHHVRTDSIVLARVTGAVIVVNLTVLPDITRPADAVVTLNNNS